MSLFVATRADACPVTGFAATPPRIRLPALPGLIKAFDASGGVATGSEVAELLRPWVAQPISLLARWIVARQVITLAWSAESFLPLFQFDLARSCVRAGMAPIISELSAAMDDEDITHWFALPNSGLGGAAPADAFATPAAEVLAVARAYRFIAIG